MKTKSHSLRRKARSFHRKADILLADRRVWQASQARNRALQLEAQADALDVTAEESLTAGFSDADLPLDYVTVQIGGAL